jgi:TfoX/Sxy family transcriptional regulator of competence genes
MAKDPSGWSKSPPDLVARFEAGTGPLLEEPGVARRQMFGYPACFVDGHMFTSLFQDRWVIRLPEDGLADLGELGGVGFAPMPGRPMTGYMLLPPELTGPDLARPWLERALAHARNLPPKAARSSRTRRRPA